MLQTYSPKGTIIPPRADVAFTGIDELAIRNKVINKQNSESSRTDHETCESKNRDDLIKNKEQTQNTIKSNTDRNKVIIEDWVDSDDEEGNPEEELKDHAIIDSGCSGSMTGDKDKLSDFKEYKGGYVAFGNDPKGGRITGKGTIKTSCIDFENVSYVKESNSNRLSVSQICDKKHNVLFTDTECLILSPEFKIVDENLVLLRAPRKNDVYSLNLKSIIPSGGVTCLVAKASEDEAILWHKRLGHVNFKNINKLVKSNLVRGLPSKTFKHNHSCLACKKGKQHKASCKKLEERTVREPLELLHMDLFGPVSVASLNRKKYCLVVTDDCSRFSWVFFLVYKDETYDILHDLIVGLENKLRRKVKTIRCDHGTEFKNKLMNENFFCASKRTQRSTVLQGSTAKRMFAERKNRTLIEAARTMLADSLLPIQFWAEAVHTACYVLNRVLVTKPQMKTPYELLMGKSPNISMRSERKRWIFHGNSFDDENKDTEEEIDLDLNNMDNTIDVSSSSTLKIHKNHPQKMHHWSYYSRSFKQENSCKKNQRRLTQALHDEGWGRSNCKKNDSVKLQGMYEVLCDLPDGKRVIGTKWVFRNKRDIKEGDSPFIKWMSRSAFLLCAISRRGCMSIKPQLLDAWDRKDIMLVQVYVDDIIIGSNLGNHKVKEFEELMQRSLRKITSGGCQYLGRRDCILADARQETNNCSISSTDGRICSSCKLLWTDNESTICIVKNPVFHSKTKHIQIRHHFIRDCYDQRLINVVKVQLFGSQYWNDEPIATFKGRTACKVWTLKEALMLFLRGGLDLKRCYLR
ncbi:putative ribonuclease H-like domain-containing protein [Tanacetum coccineum]